jgi:hypothetical protein
MGTWAVGRGSGYGDSAVERRDVIAHQPLEHPVAATAVGARTAALADRIDRLGAGEHRGFDGAVVHGFAVANDHAGSGDPCSD